MRATILLVLALSAASSSLAHDAAQRPVKGPMLAPAPAPAVAPAADAASPRSTLKPAPAANADTSQPRQRLVTVFGTEACPKPTSTDEIVVCARLPDSELYRIPERLRSANNTRVSPFQANRALLLGDATGGAGGSIGSCSAVGSGGMIGCNQRQVDAWAQDRTNRMTTSPVVVPKP
ncbi:MAG: hypothetical protein H7268_08050 [Sandarakinorhabdus sp.]|nr:hypothetical protein [Sandarakinorhabdus sp.]